MVLVERIRLTRLREGLVHVLLADVLHDGLDGTDRERLLAHDLQVLALLTHVDRKRDDVDVLVLAQPLNGDRGVETAGVRENNLLFAHRAAFPRPSGSDVSTKLGDAVSDGLRVGFAPGDDQYGVIATDRSEDLVEFGGVKRGRHALSRPGRRLDKHQLARAHDARHELRDHPLEVQVLGENVDALGELPETHAVSYTHLTLPTIYS